MRSSVTLFLSFALFACESNTDESSMMPTDVGTGSGGMMADAGVLMDDLGVDSGTSMSGSLSIMPNAVDFEAVGVGSRGQADVVFSNPGEGDIDITVFDGLQAPFSISRSLPLRIPAGAQRTVVVAFEPSAAGSVSQDVVVQTSQDGLAATLSLRGEGESASGMLESDTLNFGILQPGETHSDFVVINNVSSTRLTVTAVEGVQAPFSIPDGQVPVSGEPMEAVRFLVSFTPEDEGDFSQTVTVRTNSGDFEVDLVGRALAPGALSVHTVRPSWGSVARSVQLMVRGGPFPDGIPAITVGEMILEDVERLDENTVTGRLEAPMDAPLGPQDVRVDFDGAFGLLTGRFIVTAPVAEGRILDETTDVSAPIGPEGNPWRIQSPLAFSERIAIEPGTVVIAESQPEQATVLLDFQAGADIGSRDGVVVFSSSDPTSINWNGLRFSGGDEASSLLNAVVEYAGVETSPRIRVSIPRLSIEGLTIQGDVGDTGIEYAAGSVVSLVGAYFDEDLREAMHLEADSIGQLSSTTVRSGLPIRARASLFGRRPIGAGHQWSNPFIGLYGSTGTVRLSNQPAGIGYLALPSSDPIPGLAVADGDILTIPSSVDFRLKGQIVVSGTLDLGGDDQIMSDGGGLTITETGTLRLASTPDERMVFGHSADQWPGVTVSSVTIEVNGQIEGDFFSALGGEIILNADFDVLEGLTIESAHHPLRVQASGHLAGLVFESADQGIVISSGNGRIDGLITSGAQFDVEFQDVELCDQWDLAQLQRGDDAPLVTNCP